MELNDDSVMDPDAIHIFSEEQSHFNWERVSDSPPPSGTPNNWPGQGIANENARWEELDAEEERPDSARSTPSRGSEIHREDRR